MSNAVLDIEGLRRAISLASPQELDTAEIHRTDEWLECPFCTGEGSVDGETFTNYDGEAVGVQFFGVGDQFVHNEQAFRLLWRSAPTLIKAVDDLSVSLKHAIDIIEKHVPRDALGTNAQGDPDVPGGYQTWPLLDEYLHHMKEALANANPQSTDPAQTTSAQTSHGDE